MKVALIAEGKTDQAVLINILKGWSKIDRDDIYCLRPDLEYDNTDLAQMDAVQFSNWTLVKQECIDGEKIQIFLDMNPEAFIVVQIDAFECDHIGYDITKAVKNKSELSTYSEELRLKILTKIQLWQSGRFIDKTAYAIAIEEIEAWILTLMNNQRDRDTSYYNNPKDILKEVMNLDKELKKLFSKDAMEMFLSLSRDFGKPKNLERAKLKNKSLDLFLQDLDKFKTG